jgi:hypothetical protein
MEPCNALVLLGYSNTGKDTIATMLGSRLTGVTNAKFSALTKQLLADVCGVSADMMENREWRESTRLFVNGVQTNLTPFDLLTALYVGAPGTNLASANVEWTLKNIAEDSFPVFTDIRRVYEFNCVTSHYNPLVIFLTRDDSEPGVNDNEIADVFYAATDDNIKTTVIHIAKGEQPEQTFERVLKELKSNTNQITNKPTLHIYLAQRFNVAINHILRGRLPGYEPIDEFAVDLANLCAKYHLPRYGFNKMFDAAISELNWADMVLAPVKQDSSMAWHSSHENILDKLRDMANLRVTVLDESMLSYAYETFKRTEII